MNAKSSGCYCYFWLDVQVQQCEGHHSLDQVSWLRHYECITIQCVYGIPTVYAVSSKHSISLSLVQQVQHVKGSGFVLYFGKEYLTEPSTAAYFGTFPCLFLAKMLMDQLSVLNLTEHYAIVFLYK